MPKVKSWILVLTWVAGLLLVACTQPQNRLRVTMTDAGDYAVDVAHWLATKESGGGVLYTPTFLDGTAEVTAVYTGSINELPAFPDDAVQLTSYKVTWHDVPPGASIPPTSGAVNEVLQADPTGKLGTKIPIVVVPGGTKETCATLVDLEGDPNDDPNTFVGQVMAKGQIDMYGTVLNTGENIMTSVQFIALFADYVEPNTDH